MAWLIAYDIVEDTLREKMANKLLELGWLRIQKSVFIGDPTKIVLKRLKVWLKKNQSKDANSKDFILLLPCTAVQLNNAILMGKTPNEWQQILEPPNTLII